MAQEAFKGHQTLSPEQEDMLRAMREGYTPLLSPLPDVVVEEIPDQPMGRTPFDDLKDQIEGPTHA